MDALLPGRAPREHEASCSRCVMVPPEGSEGGARYFHPQTKCCTFHPTIPNYLVGSVLRSGDGVGMRERVATGVGVKPLMLEPPPLNTSLYEKHTKVVFGKARLLRCPFYRDGGCGIWEHRNATCATWFCKHRRGAVGGHFWQRQKVLLAVLEHDLAKHCVLELGAPEMLASLPEPGEEKEPTAEELDGEVLEAAHRTRWGSFAGREAEFYEACAELVFGLSWEEALAIAGPEARARAKLLQDAFSRLVEGALPSRLRRVEGYRIASHDAERVRLVTYSEYDPLQVPSGVLALLGHFDGRAVQTVREELEADYGVTLDDEFLGKLVDHGLLASAD